MSLPIVDVVPFVSDELVGKTLANTAKEVWLCETPIIVSLRPYFESIFTCHPNIRVIRVPKVLQLHQQRYKLCLMSFCTGVICIP